MKRKIFIVAAVFSGSHLIAQEDSTRSLDEVVITANKYPNKTSLTGKVVTVITRQQLERSGGKNLAQIITEQAGIYINGANSNEGKDKSIFLRGARIDHTLITIDGVPVYDPTGIGGNFDIRNLAIENVERVEILKGSQSTLYGSDAIAGVINIITRKTADKKLGGFGLASYGSNNTVRLNAGFNGKEKAIDYNAAYTFYDTKGINETVNRNNTPGTDLDGYTQNSFQAVIGITPKTNIRIQPMFRFNNIKGDIDQGAFTDELDYSFTQKSWQAGLRNEFGFGKSKLNLIYNYNNIDRNYLDDSVKSRNGFYTYSNFKYQGQEHFVDAFVTAPLGGNLKLTGGADFRSSNSTQELFSLPAFGPNPAILSGDSLKQNQVGVYAALNYTNPNGLNIEGGGRVNFHSEYGNNTVWNINPSFLVKNKVKLFANISTGYKTPSLYQLYSEYGNKELKPESAFTVEGGLQYYSSDNKFTARAVYFSRHVEDVIFFYFNPVTFQQQYINQDEQDDHGVEVEASLKLTEHIAVKAFYTYVDGEVTTKLNGKDTTYFNLNRRPKSTFGLNVGAQVTPQFFASVNLQSIGERKDSYFDMSTFQTVNLTLKSYVLVDLYAEYALKNKKVRFFADLRNALNVDYSEIAGYNTLGLTANGGVRVAL